MGAYGSGKAINFQTAFKDAVLPGKAGGSGTPQVPSNFTKPSKKGK